MPANSKHYQQAYRDRTKAKRRVVSVSMDADDHQELSRYAKAHEMSLSRFLREASLHQARSASLQSPQTVEELKELRRVILNISNNLNQIAHHSNVVKRVTQENEVFEHIAMLEGLVRNFVTRS